MNTDKTYDFAKMEVELSSLLASLNICRAKDSLILLLLQYCKQLHEVPSTFATTIEDLDALYELLSIIQRYEMDR